MMKPVCIIPARAGSKGVSNKNIRNIGGKPLIYYTIKSALESKIFSHVIVSTEDKKTAAIAKKYGAEVPFIRPKYLAGDNTPLEPVLLHTIKKLNSLGIYFEMFVLRDCTVPFNDANDKKGAIKHLKKYKCNSICASVKAHPNPFFQMWELDRRGFLKISTLKISESWISMMRGRIDLRFFLNERYGGILASLKKSAGCDKFPRRCAGWSSLPPPRGRSFNKCLHIV